MARPSSSKTNAGSKQLVKKPRLVRGFFLFANNLTEQRNERWPGVKAIAAVAPRLMRWLNVVTMNSATTPHMETPRFWEQHPDSTQAAVHLALQWLAFVYPTSEKYLDETLREALPYTDDQLSRRWRSFLEDKEIDDHVRALQWLSSTLSKEQLPFLIDSCWRLLLVNHELPSHVPLALRLLGRVLNVPEFHILDIGKRVQHEVEQQPAEAVRTPLLPEDPRYLDRIEWRLYGISDPIRRTSNTDKNPPRGWLRTGVAFVAGLLVGLGGLSYLVWGPAQLGREPIPRMSHQSAPLPPADTTTPPDEPRAEPAPGESSGPELSVSSLDQSALPEASQDESTALLAPVDDAPVAAPDTGDSGAEATPIEPDTDGAGQSEASSLQEPEPELVSDTDTDSPPPVTEEPDVLMEVTASILNVREAPSTSADIIIKLGEGARVWMEPEGAQDGWNRIRVEGRVGYASSNFMEPVN